VRAALLPLAVAAAMAASGCGGTPGARSAERPPAARSDAAVIRAWADTLRSGRPDAAARYFATPAVVQNGTPPLTLASVEAVRAFNRALPCGARLLRTTRVRRYTVATFRLTERRGGACGSGVGGTAATAFRLRAGKIVEWRRVAVPGAGPAAPSQSV
jgi:hypothetical protein